MRAERLYGHMTSDPLDSHLHLVADRDRRLVLECLCRDDDGQRTFEELVDHLHERDPESSDERRDREGVAIRLQHSLLPKLADHGVVEFDHRSGSVRYQPDESVEALLDMIAQDASVSKT